MVRPALIWLLSSVLSLAWTSSRASAQEGISPETLAAVKDASVFIHVILGNMGGSGSGFVIRVQGGDVDIVTNHHVITPGKAGRPADALIKVVFQSGAAAERTVKARVIAFDEVADLAILRVSGLANPPKPIDAFHSVEPAETMALYTFGFPLGRGLAIDQGKNPAINVSRSSITSLRRKASGKLEFLQVDGSINSGNSGGPLVDVKGRLIGVCVSRFVDVSIDQINLVIPRAKLLGLLEGQSMILGLTLDKSEGANSKYKVEVTLADPWSKMKSVALLFAPLTASNRTGASDGEPLANARRVDLTISGDKATGDLSLATAQSVSDRRQWVQVHSVDGSGKSSYSKPLTWIFSNARIGSAYDLRTGQSITATADPNRLAAKPGITSKLPERDDASRGLIAPFYTVVFAPKKKLAITLDRDGTARVYDSTTFALKGSAKLAGPSAQAVLDANSGRLYAYVAVDGFLQFDRDDRAPRGQADLHLYDMKALLESKAADPDERPQPEALVPVATFPRNANVVGMCLSPNGKWIYALERTADAETGGPAKLVRINTVDKKPDMEVELAEGTDTLCLTRDGRTLYATARSGQGKGLLQVIEASSLELKRGLIIDREPNDVEATNGGFVLIACRGGTVLVAEMIKTRTVVGSWFAQATDPSIRLAADQKRVYVGDQRGGFSSVSSWILTGASKTQAATRTGALAAIGQNAPLLAGEMFLTPDGLSLLMRSGAVLPVGPRKPTAIGAGSASAKSKRIDEATTTSAKPKAIP